MSSFSQGKQVIGSLRLIGFTFKEEAQLNTYSRKWRAEMLKVHPDKNLGDQRAAEERTKKLNEANDFLKTVGDENIRRYIDSSTTDMWNEHIDYEELYRKSPQTNPFNSDSEEFSNFYTYAEEFDSKEYQEGNNFFSLLLFLATLTAVYWTYGARKYFLLEKRKAFEAQRSMDRKRLEEERALRIINEYLHKEQLAREQQETAASTA